MPSRRKAGCKTRSWVLTLFTRSRTYNFWLFPKVKKIRTEKHFDLNQVIEAAKTVQLKTGKDSRAAAEMAKRTGYACSK